MGAGTLFVWSLEGGPNKLVLQGHTGEVRSVALTPDGRYAISISAGVTAAKELRVWNLRTAQNICAVGAHPDEILRSVVLTPDGHWAVSASHNGALRVWDLARGLHEHLLSGHTNDVRCLAITRDGRCVASASDDGPLRVWGLEAREQVAAFTSEARMISCAFAPEDRTVIAGDERD
jgi:WD40 repeat protein